jgi:hypothetical protein
MTEYKLRVKVDGHEFEAEGPAETVKEQFESFKNMIASLSKNKPENTPIEENGEGAISALPAKTSSTNNVDRIFRPENRVVSLTVPPASETDAVLLILYGQRHYRNNENPTGSEIIDGLEQSGYRTPRIDRILTSLAGEGAVIITGAHRGKKYRLTNQGFTRAEGVVKDALAKLP